MRKPAKAEISVKANEAGDYFPHTFYLRVYDSNDYLIDKFNSKRIKGIVDYLFAKHGDIPITAIPINSSENGED